jgi:hypothetical protein
MMKRKDEDAWNRIWNEDNLNLDLEMLKILTKKKVLPL